MEVEGYRNPEGACSARLPLAALAGEFYFARGISLIN